MVRTGDERMWAAALPRSANFFYFYTPVFVRSAKKLPFERFPMCRKVSEKHARKNYLPFTSEFVQPTGKHNIIIMMTGQITY